MSTFLPIAYAALLWWFSTGVVLYLDGLPRSTFGRSLRWGALLAAIGFALVLYAQNSMSAASAYVSFTGALLIWAWIEMTFLMGWITGPSQPPCRAGCKGRAHFVHAARAVFHHELLIAAVGALLLLLVLGSPNETGAWTFAILWVMRLSAKLNLFLGVPNPGTELLPSHMQYLRPYLRRRSMNALFPLSVIAATVLTIALVQAAMSHVAGGFDATALWLLAGLSGLALLEHWLLVVPIPSTWLWRLGLRSHEAQHEPRLAVSRLPR